MLVQAKYSHTQNLNFMAFKTQYTGLYKQYPEMGKDVVTALKNNPIAARFCEQYGSIVECYAYGNPLSGMVNSSLRILYNNPADNKLVNFCNKFINPINEISCFAEEHAYNLSEALEKTTSMLKKIISNTNEDNVTNPYSFTSRIKAAEFFISEDLSKQD